MLVSNSRAGFSVALMCLGLAVHSASHAALFDDTEARKRILEVETKQTADHDAQQTAIGDLTRVQKSLEKRVQSLEALINGKGLLDMQNQLELMRQDVAQLKGDLEVVTHQLEEMRAKQNTLYTDLDTRLRKLESGALAGSAQGATTADAATDAKSSEAAQQESRAFSDAESFNQAGKYKEAFNAYDAFLKTYSGSKLAPDAMFGMGYSQFGLKNYKSAISTQQKFLENYPAHPLAANAMMNMANSQIQLGQIPEAKKTLKNLISTYPSAEVTSSAQKRLKVLESIK